MSFHELALRLGLALLFGSAIGLERQWRSRYVGLRTNTLVTLGSAAMMAFAERLPTGDPTAIVHIIAGIITGIGFLGAGVIIHEGITIKGCNTAATLWCSVAVGLFAGAGYFAEAALLTVCIMLVNVSLRPIVHYINSQTKHKETASDRYDNSGD